MHLKQNLNEGTKYHFTLLLYIHTHNSSIKTIVIIKSKVAKLMYKIHSLVGKDSLSILDKMLHNLINTYKLKHFKD